MKLKQLFPRYDRLGDQWRARLLGAVISLGVPVTILLTIVYFLAGRGFSLDVALMLASLLFEVSVWLVWIYIGLKPASIWLVIGATVLCSVCIYYSGGIASAALVAQAFVVVITALLTSPRTTLILLTATTAFNFLLVTMDGSQLVVDPLLNDGAVVRFSMQTAMLVLLAATISYSNRLVWALTRNLEHSEYRFRALFEQTSDAVFITGLDLKLIEANDQAARMLAYQPEEMSGLPVKELFPAEEWTDVQKRFELVQSTDLLAPTTRRFLTKRGDEVMLETNLSLVQDEQGNPLHYQSTGRDVTRKMIEEQRMKSTLVHMAVKASTDSLTGILNRETILQHAKAEWERAARDGQPISVLIGDMDQLKKINDTYGHAAGDQALNAVARVIDQHKRPYDWVGRYGGDEFLVVLPGAGLADAKAIARRMERAIQKERVRASKKSLALSFSLGAASTEGHTPPIHSMTELIELADVALYKAKRKKS